MQRKKKEPTYQPWNYKNKPLTEEEERLFPQQYEGFVYLLTHERTTYNFASYITLYFLISKFG